MNNDDGTTIAALQAEVATLRQRITELEGARAAQPATPPSVGLALSPALLESLPFPIAVYRADGLLDAANSRAEQVFGTPRSSVVGSYNLFQDPVADRHGLYSAVEQAFRGSVTTTPPIAYSAATDEGAPQVWFEATAFPLYDAAGGILQVALFFLNVTEHLQIMETLRESQELFQSVIEYTPSAISVKDIHRRVLLINQTVEKNFNVTREQFVGKTEDELFGPEVISGPGWADTDLQVVTTRLPVASEATAPLVDGEHIFISTKFPLFNARNEVYAIGCITTDITEQKRAEQERLSLQEQVIAAQQAALRELSTPLVPIGDGIVAMPLVGMVDGRRAQQIMETLLEGIAAREAETAILDITGVKVVDTQVANALVQTAKAARYLGARVILTGISPEVAQSLVHLQSNLNDLVTSNNLQSGIAYALTKQGSK